MIELFAIILQFFIFLLISSFPLNVKNLNSLLKTKNSSFNYIDCHAINILILFNILLFASFLNLNLKTVFIVIFISSLSLLSIRWKEYLELINKKNFLKFIFFFIVCISIFVSTAQLLKLNWDGFHWITKALVFFNDANIQNLKYSQMPEYPHMGGYLWAFFWKNSFLELEYFGRLFYVYFYLISIFTIFNVLNYKSEKILFIMIFFVILLTYDPYLFAGYQEYLMFSTLLVASRFIFEINFSNKIEYRKIFLVLFTMSIAMWFKDEGMFYFLIFGTLLILMTKNSLKSKISLILMVLIVIYIQQFLQKNIIGIYGFNVDFLNERSLSQLLDINFILLKSIAITKHLFIAFIKYPIWLLILFSIFIIHINDKKSNSLTKYFTFSLIINILFVYTVYLHDYNPTEFILSVTLDRVIFQTSSFYILMIILILNKFKLIKTKF